MKKNLHPLITIMAAIIMIWPAKIYSQVKTESIDEIYSGDKTGELEYYQMEFDFLEEMLNVSVEVASMFEEDELVVGSTVSRISSKKWKQLGARRFHETLNNELSVQSTSTPCGPYAISIRGYTNSESRQGIAMIIDGIPANDIIEGTSIMAMPNCELGILDRIELIKGPGSAIYGSDAFHGVLSLKTFESDKDYYSAGASGAFPLYGDANLKISQGLGDKVRINAAVAGSHQGDQEIEYIYEKGAIQNNRSTFQFGHNSGSGVFKVNVRPGGKFQVRMESILTYIKTKDFHSFHATFKEPKTYLEDKDRSNEEALYSINSGSVIYTMPGSIILEAMGYFKHEDGIYNMYVNPAPATLLRQDVLKNHYGGQFTVKQEDNPINLQWFAAYSYVYGKINDYTLTVKTKSTIFLKEPSPAEGFERQIHGFFTQFKWGAVRDRLYLLFGGRIDKYIDDYADYNPQFSPRGGIIFLPTEKSSLKALYGRAFKAPTQEQIFGLMGVLKPNSDVKPETIDCYELDYMYKEKNWKTTAAVYFSDWRNGIIAEENFNNAGKNRSYGCELNLFYAIDPFAADLGFAYSQSMAIDKDDPWDPGNKRDYEYNLFPEYSIIAGIYYTLKPADIIFFLNNRIFLNMTDRPNNLYNKTSELPHYYRMDLNVSRVFGDRAEIYIDIRNILNRKNRVPSTYGIEEGLGEPGISVMLRAGYRL